MTDREKLLKILKDNSSCRYNSCLNCCAEKDCFMQQVATELIDAGVIVLPCKVGDTVYQIANGWRICESKITWFYWDKDYKRIVYECNTDLAFSEEAIGKSVFLSKEEAEAALKEREM